MELAEGEFAIGRNASCQLVLDDPLVSRRHAILTVTSSMVSVEDLRSRNGVQVGAQTIVGPRVLAIGEMFLVGSQELVVVRAEASGGAPRVTLPRIPTSDRPEPSMVTGEIDGLETSMVRRGVQFKLLGSVAGKALAMGRTAEAERLLASALGDVIESSRAGRLLPASLVDEAAQFSAKLAGATGKGGWADYVIELYAAQDRLPPAEVIDELHHVYRKISNVDLLRLRAYVERMRGRGDNFGPRERFLMQRLEGLERLANLKG